jgi:hypothetical protein
MIINLNKITVIHITNLYFLLLMLNVIIVLELNVFLLKLNLSYLYLIYSENSNK